MANQNTAEVKFWSRDIFSNKDIVVLSILGIGAIYCLSQVVINYIGFIDSMNHTFELLKQAKHYKG